jgi:hypothetical protein
MPTLNDLLGTSTSTSQTVFTDNYIIVEPLDGPTSVDDVMDRFPSEIYQQSRSTHLYAFLTALCGDAGAGLAKKQAYIARLKYEADFLNFQVLDQIYDAQFQIHRLKSETYADISTTDANTDTLWNLAQAADNQYFQRVQDFWTGTRYGNSPTGIQYVAEAGTGLDCEIVEHYKWIYDQFSDDPLGLDPDGISIATEEFVVIPRYDPNGTWHYVPDVLPDWIFTPPQLADDPESRRRIIDLGVEDTGLIPSRVYVYGLPVLFPDIERNMIELLDRIRPVNTFATVRLEEPVNVTLALPNPTASSIFLQLTRYVTGNPKVSWPPTDPSTNSFIQANIENPTGTFPNSVQAIPTTFYTILLSGVSGYTEKALTDPAYNTPGFHIAASDGIAPVDKYVSEHNGPFFDPITQIYPELNSATVDSTFPVIASVASNNTPLILQGPGSAS